MLRHLLTLLSLLLCVATCVLWVRSYRNYDHITWMAREGRHTLRSDQGAFGLFVQPRRAANANYTRVAQILKHDPTWFIQGKAAPGLFFPGPDRMVSLECTWLHAGFDFFHDRVGRGSLDDAFAPLLDGLENKETFVRAHVALTETYGTESDVTFEMPWIRKNENCIAKVDGLRVTLHSHRRSVERGERAFHLASATADPTQLAFIRDQWHRRLDESRISISYGTVVFLLAIVAFALNSGRLLRLIQGRVWSASKRCSKCGYDLRATPERCPECGTVPSGKIKVSN
jgi:hypothetical protein